MFGSSLCAVSGMNRSKIDKVTLNALRTRQPLVKGERLVRHEMRAVLTIIGRNIFRINETKIQLSFK